MAERVASTAHAALQVGEHDEVHRLLAALDTAALTRDSTLALAGATVSAPLDWDELTTDLTPAKFTIRTMLPRLEERGDLFRAPHPPHRDAVLNVVERTPVGQHDELAGEQSGQ